MPIVIENIPFIGRRRRRAPQQAALTLVSAAYVVAESVTLTFSRAIDAIAPADVIVYDDNVDIEYGGTADVTLIGPATVRIVLIESAEFSGPGVTLTATGGAGIVAAGDGAPWAGVSGYPL